MAIRGHNRKTLLCMSVYLLSAVAGPATAAPAAQSGAGLLRGVASVRKVGAPLRVSFTIDIISPAPSRTLTCTVECDGGKRRFQVAATNLDPETITIFDDTQCYRYRRKDHEDVLVYDKADAVERRGDLCFDPRILGVSSVMPADATLKKYLPYEGAGQVEVVGKEEVSGTSAWRVKCVRDSTEDNFWIEEPSFRLLRRTTEWDNSRIDMRSEYDPKESSLPKRVHIRRIELGRESETVITVTKVEWPESIPEERFQLVSMDLPKNTAVIDSRIERRVGFWTSRGLSEGLEVEREQGPLRPFEAPKGGGRRWVMVVMGTLFLLLVVFIALRYHRARV
jgi:hypothetical protein